MVFALLISAMIWNFGTWYLGLPASSSHTLVGSIIGVGLGQKLYPAGPARTWFGLILRDGTCIPFDEDSNQKVEGILKAKTNWTKNTVKIKPKVEVTGT